MEADSKQTEVSAKSYKTLLRERRERALLAMVQRFPVIKPTKARVGLSYIPPCPPFAVPTEAAKQLAVASSVDIRQVYSGKITVTDVRAHIKRCRVVGYPLEAS